MQIALSDQQVLTLAFAEVLRDATVSHWGTLFQREFNSSELSEALQKRIDKTFDKTGLVHFAEFVTHKLVLERGFAPDEDEVLLRSIKGMDDHVELAKHLVGELEKAPYKYDIVVRGPATLSNTVKRLKINYKISEQLSLVSSEILKDKLLFSTGESNVDDWIWRNSLVPDKRVFNPRYLYFRYKCSGYIGPAYGSRIINALSDEIRAFYGGCLAHGILRPFDIRRDQLSLLFLGAQDDGFLLPYQSIDSDIERATHFITGAKVQSEYRKSEKFEVLMKPVQAMFSCSNSTRLKTAAMWFLRAMSSRKPLDKVLESAITLEVLLGDREMSDRVGLTKLMANRCAYALGKSSSERDENIKFFQDFYRLRSEIVHTGRFVLGDEEEMLVEKGLRLAGEMLVYEQSISC